jgi:hypothetical protein
VPIQLATGNQYCQFNDPRAAGAAGFSGRYAPNTTVHFSNQRHAQSELETSFRRSSSTQSRRRFSSMAPAGGYFWIQVTSETIPNRAQ